MVIRLDPEGYYYIIVDGKKIEFPSLDEAIEYVKDYNKAKK